MIEQIKNGKYNIQSGGSRKSIISRSKKMRKITEKTISDFKEYLLAEEKSEATNDKYIRDIKAFCAFIKGREFDKKDVLEYKSRIVEKYAPASVNSMLSSLNALFAFLEWHEMKVKTLKVQKQVFLSSEKELTKGEYERLLGAARSKGNERLYMLMQTICSSGIRVSEVRFITVEAINREYAEVTSKGKRRRVFLPRELCVMLKRYCRERDIKSGAVFVTKNGQPLDRSNIWSDMKKLCKSAGVSEKKVFPHNLRRLFARTYYSLQKDIVRLADTLGHSSINTTRIYIISTGIEHRRKMENMRLIL